jgi:hypothetical protein
MDYPRCQHIKVNGVQCGSPALHEKKFCYFHQSWRDQSPFQRSKPAEEAAALARASNFSLRPRFHMLEEFPSLEDGSSIQIAINQVMRLLLCRQIEHKDASLLLYALQIATQNLRFVHFEPRDPVLDPDEVLDTTVYRDYGEDEEDEEDGEDGENGEEDEEGAEGDDGRQDDDTEPVHNTEAQNENQPDVQSVGA